MGYGEIFQIPKENTTITIKMESSGKFGLLVKHSNGTNSIEKSIIIEMEHFHMVFDNPNDLITIKNGLDELGLKEEEKLAYQLGWNDLVGGVSAGVGFRGNIPHNELFWRQKNGRWNIRPTTKGNYVYNRSYQLKGQKLSAIKGAGNKLGVVGAGFIAYDVISTGELKASHGVNSAMIAISFTGLGAIVAGLWFVADVGTGLITGKSISERIDDWSGSVILWETGDK